MSYYSKYQFLFLFLFQKTHSNKCHIVTTSNTNHQQLLIRQQPHSLFHLSHLLIKHYPNNNIHNHSLPSIKHYLSNNFNNPQWLITLIKHYSNNNTLTIIIQFFYQTLLNHNHHSLFLPSNITQINNNHKNHLPLPHRHYPQTKHTVVADTPEMQRLSQASKLQSQVDLCLSSSMSLHVSPLIDDVDD